MGCPPKFTILQPKPVPPGSKVFEVKRAAVLEAFQDKVPVAYYLPKELLDNIACDVTDIPAKCGILTAEEIAITEDYDTVGLAAAIAARKLTAVAVAVAFAKRAIIAHQLTCCLTQWFMEEAVAQAQQLDTYLAEHGKPVGPLHGVPVSIKEHIPIAGVSSSSGCLASIVLDKTDSQLVGILRRLGAVFYCKTNQPQSLMHLETDSFWGRTTNPFNIHLSAGGSTGGEAALIAMKGSVVGVGTDIGGSIRGPAAFCGIYGFKPTSNTLPMQGFIPSPFPAELNILGSTGPMCRSLRDMDFFMSSVLADKPHLLDPRLVPIPWTGLQTSSTKILKIGIVENDGFVEPQPPVKRAIAWARELLMDARHTGAISIKSFKISGAAEVWRKARRMYWPDGGSGCRDAILSGGEPLHPLSEWIWKDAEPFGMLTAADVSNMRGDRDNYRLEFARAWQEQDIDVLICPAYVGPACAHDTAFTWTYTSLYNFVDYPAVVFPTPIVTEVGEQYDPSYQPLSEACEQVKQLWEETDFRGAPVNLQLVARKYHDNELFGTLSRLKDILGLN
ncbi:acetamidase [Microdochium trichocladiopsis]|uniref:Acetamidase n=1 Tax=Microdochium trichocladiopsis TaxID=1682393 RepID=A0A9P8XSH6_9PEZI|nr:acetamidase [Microdochium trichocladiopsis]KAH7012155.1 acetamidase [Microdochium trichocladiopsis]